MFNFEHLFLKTTPMFKLNICMFKKKGMIVVLFWGLGRRKYFKKAAQVGLIGEGRLFKRSGRDIRGGERLFKAIGGGPAFFWVTFQCYSILKIDVFGDP